MTLWTNLLYFGGNLSVLCGHIPDESVAPIYFDPPFNSNATHNVLFKECFDDDSAAQIMTFDDTFKKAPRRRRREGVQPKLDG